MHFSVIIPSYNCEAYIESTLGSLWGQTLDDFEVIVVDDGSTDGTGKILDCSAEKHRNLQVLHSGNEGPLIARRKGASVAKGDYAVFVDADDCLREDALEIIAAAIDKTDADIVSYGLSRNEDFSTADDPSPLKPGFYSGEDYGSVMEHACEGRFNSLWGKAFRLCHIDLDAAYGAYKGLMHGEDLFQLLPILDSASSLIRIEDVLYYYRSNDGSSTAAYKQKQLEDIEVVCSRLLSYGEKWGGACVHAAYLGEARQYL